MDTLKRLTKKGGAIETQYGAELLSHCFLVLGPDNETIFNEMKPLFQDIIRTSSYDKAKPSVQFHFFFLQKKKKKKKKNIFKI